MKDKISDPTTSKESSTGSQKESSGSQDPSTSSQESKAAATTSAGSKKSDATAVLDAVKQVGAAHSAYADAVGAISADIAQKIQSAAEAFQRAQMEWYLNPAARETAERALREYQLAGAKGWHEVKASTRESEAYRTYRASLANILNQQTTTHPAVTNQILQSLGLVANYHAYLNAIDAAIPQTHH